MANTTDICLRIALPNVNVRARTRGHGAQSISAPRRSQRSESERRTVEPLRRDAGEGKSGCGDDRSRRGLRYENSTERRNCRGGATGYARGTVCTAGRVVRDFVTAVRAGIVAMCMVRSSARRVIVRSGHAGIMVAQRHAQARRRGRHPLDGDGKRQRESNQDARESRPHGRKF